MENNLHNNYLFKALDTYPYELEETMEALNYALSYNSKDTQALCLMGRVYAEQLNDYETAKQYYAEAIAHDMKMPKTYPFYIQTLLWNEDYDEAEKLIMFALTVKGVNKAVLHYYKAVLLEEKNQFKEAIKVYKISIKLATNNCIINYVENELRRVKKKIKPKKKSKKAEKSVK
jgi:tetratricopeptide (TPR) repeat protein